MNKPRLTISVVTYNALPFTKAFLESLDTHKGDIPYNLTVVDNASSDDTPEFLKDNAVITHPILNKENAGYGPAHNQVFETCDTEYFLVLNNDVLVFPNFLERLIDFADAHPEVAQFGVHSNCINAKSPYTNALISDETKLLNLDDNPSALGSTYFSNPAQFVNDFAKKNSGGSLVACPPELIGGWCFLVRTHAVRDVGGLFDPRFEVGYYEDTDLSWRLGSAGYKIMQIHELYIHHFDHASFKAAAHERSQKATSAANAIRFARKWSDTIRQLLLEQLAAGKSYDELTIVGRPIYARLHPNKEISIETFAHQIHSEFLDDPASNCADFLTRYSQTNKPS